MTERLRRVRWRYSSRARYSVDLQPRRFADPAAGGDDHAILDRNVSDGGGGPAAIVDRPAADDGVMHGARAPFGFDDALAAGDVTSIKSRPTAESKAVLGPGSWVLGPRS
jgi:hypothetical protein